MLEKIVGYLHAARVPFRLVSYPGDEPEPRVAHPLPQHALLVESRFVLVDGRLVLVCTAAGDRLDLLTIGGELCGTAIEPGDGDLPEVLRRPQAEGSIPPLGGLFGVPLVLDERVRDATKIVFAAFGADFFEVVQEDFARQEQPLIASIVRAGDLPERSGAGASPPTA